MLALPRKRQGDHQEELHCLKQNEETTPYRQTLSPIPLPPTPRQKSTLVSVKDLN